MMNMKSLLFGNESEQQSDIVLAQLSQGCNSIDILEKPPNLSKLCLEF